MNMNRKLILYIVAFATFLGPFTQTIYTPLLPEIQKHFHSSQLLVNLTISIFTFVLAMMQLVYGPLTDKKGRRRIMLFGISLYILATAGCWWAPSIPLLLLFRALQAAGIAAGSVVAVTVIGDIFEGKERGRAMGTFQMMVALGAVLGPLFGGWIGGSTSFRAVFIVLGAVGILMLLANYRILQETKPAGQKTDWFDVRDFSIVLAHRSGSAIVILGFIQYYTMYNFLVFLPDILGRVYQLSAEQKGLVYVPLSIAIVIGSFIGGRIKNGLTPGCISSCPPA